MRVGIGFLGCGNIGSGVYRLLCAEAAQFEHREGMTFDIRRILVRDVHKTRRYEVPAEALTDDIRDVVGDPEISIVLEFMGGAHPAREYLLDALAAGKTVITANKEVIAMHWHELQAAAQENGVGLYYEASVAGGIPILRTLSDSLQANKIDWLYGIINGTTNYILSRMDGGWTYDKALEKAQRMGLAEPDPTYDVGGMDAAYKLSILSTLAFHSRVTVESIYVEGVTGLSPEDMQAAREMGYCVKLLAIAKRRGQEVEARVHPTLVPRTHPLASVADSFNAIFMHGSAVGEIMLYGRGAGEQPTASAIVSDLLIAAGTRVHRHPTFQNRPHLPEDLDVVGDWDGRYYVRLTVYDQPGVLAGIANVLAEHGISIASLVQMEADEGRASIRMSTHEAREQKMRAAVERLAGLSGVHEVACMIRIEDFRGDEVGEE